MYQAHLKLSQERYFPYLQEDHTARASHLLVNLRDKSRIALLIQLLDSLLPILLFILSHHTLFLSMVIPNCTRCLGSCRQFNILDYFMRR
ncbi:hypothetical protein TNCT_88661 [Trichonephila clavata]|uniref:Uncharacterized protein n=1 Tax=Trichonephila clavata TaxID=2740835 RepID=A0A8X6J2F9_TRICU|nr:hypothetical protein TNCT_88661 [Trichonephila clavata]